MGPAGVGKSTFIDCAVGRLDMSVGHDLLSYAKGMRPVRYPYFDGIRNIVLVDTPGFDDTLMTDAQVLRQIANWLNATYKNHMKLTGVLYLHRISENRVPGTPLRNYNMFKELCGKENFKNVVPVTTMWDKVTEEVGSLREKELHADFWRSMISLGSSVHRFEGTMDSAWKIINSLSVATLLQRRPLEIQRETVDEHLPPRRKAVGSAVTTTLTAFMSGVKGIFKHLTNGTKTSPDQILQDRKHLVGRSPSLSLMNPFTTSSDTPSSSGSGTTGMISPSGPITCSAEGYWDALDQVITALRAALGVAELVRIPCLKDVIAPSLSISLSIKVSYCCRYRS
ncbi:hypothetical protein EDD16DRAFT_1472930 [Pisolithus croceorrhizus]|nr:hypothetical protein EV401DRAFT_1865587 [Pisolithus croceorrhizus]KAI6127933.1 hypothetical protein EDD16DRAFT_1472930 [Pisolithus croceorrhizus]KAI6158541.1 hypothetical protein EDD17DRAFT_1488607 [Pisolithus thermaeus]